MPATFIDSLGLVALYAVMSFAACASWALRKGTREITLLVLGGCTLLCLLSYAVVAVASLLAGTTAGTPLILMAVGQALGVAVALRVRLATGRAPGAARTVLDPAERADGGPHTIQA